MRFDLLLSRPVPLRAYAAACVIAPIAGAVGAGLIWQATGFPVEYTVKMALGGGLVFAANGLMVSLLVSQRDLDSRRRYAEATQRRNEQPAPDGFIAIPRAQYAAEVDADWRPDIVMIPTAPGQGVMLHLRAVQLGELKRRIKDNEWGLPINGMKTFSTTEVKALREEVLRHELAENHGREVRWTGDGALKILRARPTPIVEG